MSAHPVLQENCDVLKPQGTGIATYARHLARAATDHAVDVLIDTPARIAKQDHELAEIALFDDARPASPSARLRETWIDKPWRYIAGMPLGLRPHVVARSGAVQVRQGPRVDPFVGYRDVHAIHRMRMCTHAHFDRWEGAVQLKLAARPKLFHATHPIALKVKGTANIYTIHDLVPLRLPWATLDNKRRHLLMIRHLCRHADHIVTVSEHSRRDILALTKMDENRITNESQAIHVPADRATMTVEAGAELVENLFQLQPQNYFLFCGAIEPKKNLARLIEAHAASGCNLPLVIAGSPGWSAEDARGMMDSEDFVTWRITGDTIRRHRRIRHFSYLSRTHLDVLMRHARAVLMPSLAEGFGLPVLEAMMAGTPVLASTQGAMPEVAGDAGLLVDPYDVQAIAAAIRSLAEDPDLCAGLREKGLSRAAAFSFADYSARINALYHRYAS